MEFPVASPKDAPSIKPPVDFDDDFYPPISPVFGTPPGEPGTELTWSKGVIPDVPGFPISMSRFWEDIPEAERWKSHEPFDTKKGATNA